MNLYELLESGFPKDKPSCAIETHDGEAAYQALKSHISKAFETRLRVDAGELKTR